MLPDVHRQLEIEVSREIGSHKENFKNEPEIEEQSQRREVSEMPNEETAVNSVRPQGVNSAGLESMSFISNDSN